MRRCRSGPTVGSNRNRYPEGRDQRSRCGSTLPTSRQSPSFGVYLLQANLAHVFEHLPLRRLRSDTAGKTGTDFVTELFQFRHGISLLRGAVNHFHPERHGRYRSGRRRCLTKGATRNQESYQRDLGQRSHAQQLTYRYSLKSSAQLFHGTTRRFGCFGFRLPRLCSNSYPALKHWARVTGDSDLTVAGTTRS
jgi:hypothetical protein